VVSVALVAAAPSVNAQAYFGQNQTQFDRFNWQVIETEHWLVHYYPEEAQAAQDAARMAEQSYARLSRIIGHQFREKKPLLLFASRSDFGQNNVTGDLGEGTGAVTEGLRHRVLIPFTGDYKSFDRVLTHEMVHSFQYDIFSRGRASGGLAALAAAEPPLWFVEGMAEYLSIGPHHPLTDAWIRDAAINGNLPSIEAMTRYPDEFFPYRFGESVWAYVGKKWGDEVIGQILLATPNLGVDRAIKRELGITLDELSDEWREAMQDKHLPQIANLQRARKIAKPLLSTRRSGGAADLFLAPSFSSDGKKIAFLSFGNILRGQVFIDLWLGDGETGKRITRLVKSTTDPNFEELRLLYSQSAFSPDGKSLAFTAQRKGKDVLYLVDVAKHKKTQLFDLPLEGVWSPSFSPDGKQIVFSGNRGGITDLYIVDSDGHDLRQLTNDRYGDLQPQWSPDGKTIAFVSDRGPETSFDSLHLGSLRVSTLDLESRRIDVLPGQDGNALNPMWAPDGKSIAYVTDRTGIQNIFLYDFSTREHFQLTNVVGAVSAITEYSPAITWAREADRMAFTYFENGDYTVWTLDRPRTLKREPFRDTKKAAVIVAAAPVAQPTAALVAPDSLITAARDSLPVRASYYRGADGFRLSADVVTAQTGMPITVAALLDSAAFALPDTTRFKRYRYKPGFQAEYISRPTIGYVDQNSYGRGVYGSTMLVMADMLGNQRLAFAGSLNGRLSDAEGLAAYTNLGHRWQYMSGLLQEPYYYLNDERLIPVSATRAEHQQTVMRVTIRQAFAISQYPLNRFTRFEAGLTYTQMDRSQIIFSRTLLSNGLSSAWYLYSQANQPGLNFVQPTAAFVSDNALGGYTGPIAGRRYRFQFEPSLGSMHWLEYLADYRRYDPIIFNFLTVATRFQSRYVIGRDERQIPTYIGRPDFIRGYNRENYGLGCLAFDASLTQCGANRLLGSRVAIFNAELRFPLIRRFDIGILPIGLPPVDGLIFYDAGMAWSGGQHVQLKRPAEGDSSDARFPLRSYGLGIRLNLFGIALARWDYAIPLDVNRNRFWTFSLGQSF
jgi:Tol biopolymer transport system component